MSVFDEPKIDCHCHLFDPARFPYAAETPYRPAGAEVATALQMSHVFATYGVRNALLVQPNSGYGADNRCMLAAIAASSGRYKGVAVVPFDINLQALARLKAQGIVGVAFNLPFYGSENYLGQLSPALLERLVELDMFLQIQVHEQQLLDLLPLIEKSRVRLVFDHCGRPDLALGLSQPGFQALLALGRSGRASVKLSGYIKFAKCSLPYVETWPFVRALVEAFTLDHCVWGSDWPFLRAPERVDYGPLLTLVEQFFPDPADRRKLLWESPRRLFGFSDQPGG